MADVNQLHHGKTGVIPGRIQTEGSESSKGLIDIRLPVMWSIHAFDLTGRLSIYKRMTR